MFLSILALLLYIFTKISVGFTSYFIPFHKQNMQFVLRRTFFLEHFISSWPLVSKVEFVPIFGYRSCMCGTPGEGGLYLAILILLAIAGIFTIGGGQK